MAVVFDVAKQSDDLVLDLATDGVANDACVLAVHVSNSGGDDNLDEPAGWTVILKRNTSGTTNITISYRIFSGAAPDGETWTVDAGSVESAWVSYTGVGSVESGNAEGTNSAVNAPSKTASRSMEAADMWVNIWGARDPDATKPTIATPSGYTQRATNTWNQAMAIDEKAGAASDTENPGVSTTGATTDDWGAATVALLAAAAAGATFTGHWGLRVASWVFASSSGLWLPDHVSDLVDML